MTIVNHQTGECSLPNCFCHEAQRLGRMVICNEGGRPHPLTIYCNHRAPDQPAPATPTPDFTHEWDTAPRGMTNYIEQDVAEFWYRRGMQAGKDAAIAKLRKANG